MNVLIKGFKTQEQAQAFIDWYEGGGEQAFYEHLDITGLDPANGCNIDRHKNYDNDGETITAYLK